MTHTHPAPVKLDRIEFVAVKVSDRVSWPFAKISDEQGATAVVECSHSRSGFDRLLGELFTRLRGIDVGDESEVVRLLAYSTAKLQADFDLATAVSSIRTAVVELQCRHGGISMTEALGGTSQESIALYANINHSVYRGRDPDDFARAAQRAVVDGFDAIKCAPFDYLPLTPTSENTLEAARPGLGQVATIRQAVGPDVGVLVDCHSRFDARIAPVIAEALVQQDVRWFEEPLQPLERAGELACVAAQITLPVAGGERGYGEGFFAALVESGAADIAMPDVKHCGGVVEAHRAGLAAVRAGGNVSLHGPASPISQLAGAHVTAAIPGALPLEYAANQAPWRAEMLTPPEHIHGGRLYFPGGSGMGATLNDDVVRRYGTSWRT